MGGGGTWERVTRVVGGRLRGRWRRKAKELATIVRYDIDRRYRVNTQSVVAERARCVVQLQRARRVLAEYPCVTAVELLWY